MHGIARAAISKAQGGRWSSGFWSGFASDLFSPGTKLGGDGAGGFTLRTSIAAVVGGTVSQNTGGKFANGAVSGAFTHMFNAEGASIERGFKKAYDGLYKFGDFLGRYSGYRDSQYPSVMVNCIRNKQFQI